MSTKTAVLHAVRRGVAAPAFEYVPDDERRAAGKALRRNAPRESHAGWEAPANRFDPIDLLQKSNAGRVPDLVPVRFGRMSQSPFAFYRGAAAIMAADLAITPTSGLHVQACGDAHMMNFGGFATPERNVIFDLSDFDETLPAPWEWDVKRLAASVVIAARFLKLSEGDAARAARGAVRSYREHMTNYATMRALDIWYDKIDVERFAKQIPSQELSDQLEDRLAAVRKKSTPEVLFPKLAELQGSMPKIKDELPLIFHPTREQAPGLTSGYEHAIGLYRKSLPEHVRVLFDRYSFRDLAIKAVGVGSVGTWCCVALFMAADDDPIFLQVKEARQSVLEPYAGASLYKNRGQRIVAGQHLMQAASDIFLGWTRGDNEKDFYVRQLRDVKISAIIDDWDVDALRAYAKACAWTLARAHARSGDPARIAGYMGSSSAIDEAFCEFAVEYADQNQRDYRQFVKAIREGKIEVIIDA